MLISSSLFAAGSSSEKSSKTMMKSSYYYKAVDSIKNKDYKNAIILLNKSLISEKNDPDIYNYLGFSNRKLGNMEMAAKNYEKALSLDPKHKGALEYQGQLFITLKNFVKAKENLKKLDEICLLGCDEYNKLKSSLNKVLSGKKSSY